MLLADRYRIEEKLTEDALGQLFRARDLRSDRPVSVRLLTFEQGGQQPEVKRERWAREARILGSGRHPGLISVYDLDERHDPPYCVLEPLEGEPMASWLLRGQLPKLAVWHAWMQRLLGALGEVHAQGFLHRNLGPEYLFLTEKGGLKMLGLGGARTARDATLSTFTVTTGLIPRYGAPELMESSRADTRADLYSAAALGFRLLTGVDAIPIDDSRPPGEAIRLVMRGTPYRASQLRPDLGLPYDSFFERMLSVDPAGRPSSAAEANALLRALSQLPSGAGRNDDVRLIRPSESEPRESLAKMGDTIAGARVIGKLGAGGMGAVLLGRDDRRQRNVALKVLGAHQRGEREEALLAEAKALTLFSHPNVVQLFEVAAHQGRPVLVMEYVPGKTVEEYLLARKSPAPLTLTLSVLVQAATGLAAVHEQGLVHADVKASNVLIGPAGRVCVADFGLVTPAQAFVPGPVSHVAGTPEYLAPERATGALHPTLAPRIDVYSLGVMAFEMLTYRRLFSTDSPSAQIGAHINAPTPRLRTFRPDLTVELEAVILRALEKDPRARTPSCLAFRSELLSAAEQLLPPGTDARSRVLVVSHDGELRARLTSLLTEGPAPVDITSAATGAESQRLLEATNGTDLVLLDLDLPDTSAVELSAWMRTALSRPPRLMALVSEGGHPDWQVLQALGVSGFALKPPASEVLVFSVRRVLADVQREREREGAEMGS